MGWFDGDDESRRRDHPIVGFQWHAAPSVQLQGEWLAFHYGTRPEKARRSSRVLDKRIIKADRALLADFVKLSTATPLECLWYARQYGALGFCQHGDLHHRLAPKGCAARTEGTDVLEHVDWWKHVAMQADVLMRAAVLFNTRHTVDGEVLAQLDNVLAQLDPQRGPGALIPCPPFQVPRLLLTGLEYWLRWFRVRPAVTYDTVRKRFTVQVAGRPTLGAALAIQMLLAVTGATCLTMCSACGRLFSPRRRPNPNRDAYCLRCGRSAAQRAADTRRRHRNRHAAGGPPRRRASN